KEGKQPYPATQSWTTLQNIYKDIAVYKDNRYATMLKVIPVPIDLKPEADRDSFYVKYRSFLNSLDFPIVIYIRPEQYDPMPYVNSYTQRLEDYKDNPRMYELVQNEIAAFKEYIEDAKPVKKNFFVLIPVAMEKIKPRLLAKEKEALKEAKTPQEKAALAEKYSQKKLEAAARELKLRRRVAAVALQSVDPDLAVEELADESLEEAMKTLFEFAAIPLEEEEV
ncbi:MAG: hypothetical protein QME59_05975, partial [Candidatus Hydrothermarchaeota archaeon]|nr:hypothetical protein [Candidatus Hydrothermarchaeota archaeon]